MLKLHTRQFHLGVDLRLVQGEPDSGQLHLDLSMLEESQQAYTLVLQRAGIVVHRGLAMVEKQKDGTTGNIRRQIRKGFKADALGLSQGTGLPQKLDLLQVRASLLFNKLGQELVAGGGFEPPTFGL
jgi:hypothetical protein